MEQEYKARASEVGSNYLFFIMVWMRGGMWYRDTPEGRVCREGFWRGGGKYVELGDE